MLVSLYTSRVVLNALGVEDYGIYNVVGGVVAMFGILSGSLSAAISRFITFELGKGDFEKLKKIFCTSVNIQVILIAVITVLMETVGIWFLNAKMVIPPERLQAANWVFQFSVVTFALNLLSVPYNAVIIAHEKMSAFAYISIIDCTLKLIIAFIIAYNPFDKLVYYGLLIMIVGVINRSIYAIYCKRHFEEATYRFVLDKGLMKEMFGFAGWSFLGNFSFLFYTQGLNILLNVFCGPIVNAARAIAVQIENAMKQFASNVQTAINPQIIKSYSQNEMAQMKTLMFASSKVCFCLMLTLSLPVMLGADFLLRIWLGEYPEHTVNFLRLTLLCVLLETLVDPLYTANLATGKVAVYNKSLAILSLTFIPITYLAIRITNWAEIVFIINATRIFVGVIIRLFIMRYQLSIRISEYIKSVALRVIGVCVIALIVPLFVFFTMGSNTIYTFALTVLLSVSSVVLTAFFVGLNVSERNLVVAKAKHFLERNK
jgi:O-antigen/teichoic acid export membrane protein